MYIDATFAGAGDKRFEIEVVRLIRAAMRPFEMQLERIHVHIRSNPDGHSCRLHARAGRGQTVVIESKAASRLAALETAAYSLRRTIARRTRRGTVAMVPRQHDSRHPAPAPSMHAALGPTIGARSHVVQSEGSARRPRVLLALRALDPSSASLRWARVLSDALEADLDVCRVLPNLPTADGPPSGKAWLDSIRQVLEATRETRRWCADALPNARLSERLIPDGADIVDEAALRAREREVDWVVMSAAPDGSGRSATALARASGCPVLVAREPTSRSTLLVAADVSHDLHAIFSRAAALAEALHAPVLAFHDVAFHVPELSSRVNALADAWSRIQAERLKAGGHRRLPELEVLLARGTDRVETILQQARREDAEVIIVGISEDPSSRVDDVAAEVIDRALRSVLVVPSDVAPQAKRQCGVVDEARASRRSTAALALERRRWPRAGLRAVHSNERRRRWRSG